MTEDVELSIIIVNWNRLEIVRKNIFRIEKLGIARSEIIIVDNGSTDGSAEWLASLSSIRLIRLKSNVGPAQARNEAVEVARGSYLLFLDSDAMLGQRGVADLVRRLEDDPSLGIIGCRIMNAATRRLDQWIYPEPQKTHKHLEFETYSFSAAGAVVRAETIRRAGGFWNDLFIYNEEVDLSIRVIRLGYRILYCPGNPVFHFGEPSGRVHSSAYWYYQTRNWIWIFYRYYPPWERVRKIASYLGVHLVRAAFASSTRDCLRGIVAGLRRTEIIGDYPDKLNGPEIRRLRSLNRRKIIPWFGNHLARQRLPSRMRAVMTSR